MSTKTNLHYIKTMSAGRYNETTWLAMKDIHGNDVTVFMPYRQAEMIAAAFDAYGPEPVTFADPKPNISDYDWVTEMRSDGDLR